MPASLEYDGRRSRLKAMLSWTFACALSMRHRLRQEIDHRNARDDQRDADDGRGVQMLAKAYPADQRDQHVPTPDQIAYTTPIGIILNVSDSR